MIPNEIVRYARPFGGWPSSHRTQRAWINVAQWIRDMVRIEPQVMREVSKARFGDLGNWIQRGSGNVGGVCGCLVGTTAIKLVEDRNTITIDAKSCDGWGLKMDPRFLSPRGRNLTAPAVVRRLVAFTGHMRVSADLAGGEASVLGEALGNKKAVNLIKQEILDRLRERAKRSRAAIKAHAR